MNKLIPFPQKPKSKRTALRYNVRPRQISYENDKETGVATLLNISTAGLLIELATVPVSVGEEISVFLECFPAKKNGEILTVKTQVVRVNFDEFAGKFAEISPEDARYLIQYLAKEARGSNEINPSDFNNLQFSVR